LLKLGVLVAVTLGIVATLSQGSTVSSMLTQNLYEDRIVRSWNSEYGQKVLTCNERGGCKLFINGQLQFSSQDEHIYHELLVHPALSLVSDNTPRPLRVLVAGGGDGLAVREVLKYPTVEHVTVVDIDPDMTGRVGREEPVATYNAGALFDPRVRAVNQDAFTWVRDTREMFDLILVDLVDPDNEVTSKLYSLEFYKMCNRILSDGGALATQSTSPWYSAKAFWTINLTLERAFGTVVPYHYNVPSFGDWGWNLASKRRFEAEQISIDEDRTRWLADRGWRGALFFGEEDQALRDDMRKKGIVSTLVRPAVFYYYREQDAWSDWGDQP
jgi:spermidine synthase